MKSTDVSVHFEYASALVKKRLWEDVAIINIARRRLITKDQYDRTLNNFFPEEA